MEELNVAHYVTNELAIGLSLASLHDFDNGGVNLEPTLRLNLPFNLEFLLSCFNGLFFDWRYGGEVQPKLLVCKSKVYFDGLVIVVKSALFGFLLQQNLYLRVAKL